MQNYFSAFLNSVLTKMTRFSITNHLAAALLILLTPALFAASSLLETEYENHFRKHIQSTDNAEVVDLQAADQTFVGIYRESSIATVQGGIIIVHDLKQNADFPGVIRPLAEKLPEHGWSTLSLQMPVPNLDDSRSALAQLDQLFSGLSQQANSRIKAGIDHFLSKNIENISIVGFGSGAKYAAVMTTTPDWEELGNLVVVNLDSRHPPEITETLEKIKVPVLDVFGSKALKPVLDSRKERSTAILNKAENSNYRQAEIIGADHRFTGVEDSLISTIRAWLGKYSAGMTVKRQ